MAKELLLEIGVEEMPAAYMPGALKDLRSIAEAKLNDMRLKYSEVCTYGTPRRLTLFVKGLEERQEDLFIEKRGPKKRIAFDENNNPSEAGLGFARSQGVEFKNLEIREVDGVEYLFAVKKEEGGFTEDILADSLIDIIQSLTFPKSMRWAFYRIRFARPIRWLLAFYGDKEIKLRLENIESSVYTYGHRFLSTGAVEVKNPESYFRVLRDNYVVLNQNERKELIWNQIKAVAASVSGTPMENEKLLEEITYLVEYPTAFYGEFSPSYLEVPPEVLITTMIEHQRYFPVFDAGGNLIAGFVGVRNGSDFSLDLVKKGNERVLKARLEDALFFWKEDTKKPLEESVGRLKEIMFHERLGTVGDKVCRLQSLARFIGEKSGLSDRDKLDRAAFLCKADLLSSMVYEFPELQGIMGRYYAMQSNEEREVSEAIYEHYLPRFAGDELPATETGKALSLAEKLDNLVGCFAIGIRPSGSQDPYALRRQAMGIINIILDSKLKLNLKDVLSKGYDLFAGVDLESSRDDVINEVMDFILQRMRGVLLDKGISYDIIDAVLTVPSSDLDDIFKKAETIQELKHSELFQDFIVVYNRCNNLSKNWKKEGIDAELLVDKSEKDLYKSLSYLKDEIKHAISIQDYRLALNILASLRPKVDNFLESVMVMVDDEDLKSARLGLLKKIANLCNSIADFSKIIA